MASADSPRTNSTTSCCWNCFKFNPKQKSWFETDMKEASTNSSIIDNCIKIGTFNVLLDAPGLSFISDANERYEYQISTLFDQVNIDILCLNEASPIYFDMLKKSSLISKNYYMSHIDCHSTNVQSKSKIISSLSPMKHLKPKHEVLIISKYPFECYMNNKNIEIGNGNKYQMESHRCLAALFNTSNNNNNNNNQNNNNESFLVVATHLKHKEKNIDIRENEMKSVCSWINNLKNEYKNNKNLCNAIDNNNIIMLGDMNFQTPYETNFIYNNNFMDLWLECQYSTESQLENNENKENKEKEGGYTWDPTINKMINNLLPFDDRRMRLDRILLKQNANLFESINNFRLFGNKEIKNNIFPSDHFGICAIFNLFKNKENQKPLKSKMANYVKQQFTSKVTGYRTMKEILKAQARHAVGLKPKK